MTLQKELVNYINNYLNLPSELAQLEFEKRLKHCLLFAPEHDKKYFINAISYFNLLYGFAFDVEAMSKKHHESVLEILKCYQRTIDRYNCDTCKFLLRLNKFKYSKMLTKQMLSGNIKLIKLYG